MTPQAFANLMDACNKSIISLESCIAAADSCEDLCEITATCSKGASQFITHAHECISSCQSCIKVCDEMIVQFKNEGAEEHMVVLGHAVKQLGECIRLLRESIESCSLVDGCRNACQDARNVCEQALIVMDQCIESCEKHEVYYREVKPLKMQ